jgi:membrane protein implicated in regulation of membrane protease activity
MGQLGRLLLLMAALLAATGALLVLGNKLGLGRLPGDIVWRRKGTTVYFPVVTSIVVSLVLTVLVNLFLRRK